MNIEFRQARKKMVVEQLEARGITDALVLEAFRTVPREAFVDRRLHEFAYQDHPLPIAADQTISQPYVVAFMTEALELTPDSRVLEIGTGSGYAAAILGEIASSVVTVERYPELYELARERLKQLGYHNVDVKLANGTLGAPDQGPYDGIVVAAGGPEVPESLKRQLAVGGKLVIPVGTRESQVLLQVSRKSEDEFAEESLGAVRFVPLVGEQGWKEPTRAEGLAAQIVAEAEPFHDIERADLSGFLSRVGQARVVLLGEASHGTSEFYRMRARMTRELIERKGFSVVAAEADWPDARRVDDYVRLRAADGSPREVFTRFPTWMWRNREVRDFAEWLRAHNATAERKTGFYGLDLYSLHSSIERVLEYLDEVDPDTAERARARYGCLTPFESEPAAYGEAVLTGTYRECEPQVVQMLTELLERRLDYLRKDGDRYLDAVQNARLVKNAERYYRVMYYGSASSWNLRDQHMFETLKMLLEDPEARAVVWAHNSHLGDARATEMSARGEHNLGQLCRQEFGPRAYLVGFGTHTGEVAAASRWGDVMEVKKVRPSHEKSYERVFHECGRERLLLPLRDASRRLRDELSAPRLERAIGVIYRPQTELASHYFHAILPRQFDEYVWFNETSAVQALSGAEQLVGGRETYPSGL